MFAGGFSKPITGTANIAAAATAKQPSDCSWLVVSNLDAAKTLSVSFDGGKTYFTVNPAMTVSFPASTQGLNLLYVKASADGCAYSILWVTK